MTVRRIDERFAALARENRAAFVAYVMAGDPDAETSLAILHGLVGAGADLLEVGFPFSDPMAEGPPIQRATRRALDSGMTLLGVFDLVRRFRERDADTPLILMGYTNPLASMGLKTFATQAGRSGVDGVIVVDCPPEEAAPLADELDLERVALIRLATPTTDDARLAVVAARTSGFVYYVSVAGVTGAGTGQAAAVAPAVARVRQACGLPVAVGFGIRHGAQAAEIARIADAVVVGSALVEAIAQALAQNRDPVSKVVETATTLAKSVRSARVDPRRMRGG
ncbi:MAG TPA: tryptophan synthase subunit alpha [Caulobacteraceae bacterium]